MNKQHAAAVAASHVQSHDDDSSDGGNEEWNELDENGQEGKSSKAWVPAIDDPNYFEVLSPEEIYDSFFSIRRMGFIANRIIRKLNETKHIVSSKILEKRKKLKALQRKQFEQLSPAGIEYLKVLLKMGKSLKLKIFISFFSFLFLVFVFTRWKCVVNVSIILCVFF